MQNYHYETDRASIASVGTPSTTKSFLPRRVPKRGQTDDTSTTWRGIPQSATAGHFPDPVAYRRADRSSATWTLSSGDVGGCSDAHELQDRGDFVREYNRLATKHGLRLLSPDDDGHSSRETSPSPHRRGWFSRTFRRHPSGASNTSSAKSGRSERKASHRRSISDLALQLVHSAKRDVLKDEDLQSLVRLCGKSMFYLPSEYAPSSLILPTCLRATAQYLVQHATETRGVFRIPGSVRVVDALYDYYCAEGDPDEISSTTRCPSLPVHIKAGVDDVASAFKRLLSGLPGGILGSLPLFDTMVSIQSQLNGDPEVTKTKQTKLRARLIALAIGSVRSQLRRELICAVFGLLCLIGRVAETAPREDEFGRPLPTADLMGYNALGIVFGPLLAGDLLNSYSIRSSSVRLILSPVSPPPNSKWEKKKYMASEEAIALCFPDMDKIHVANSIAEMLITHWREVVKQMRSLDVLRVVGSGIADHCTSRKGSLRPSVSEPFVLRKPPEWQQNGPQTGSFQVSESPIPPSPTPETRGRVPSGGLRADRPRPTLVIPRQRPRSSRSLSRSRLNTPGPVVLLSPTEEEPSAGGASLSKRQSKGSITFVEETPSRPYREGQQFDSEYAERRQTGSPTKLQPVIPDSQMPRTVRRRGSLIKSFTEGLDVHPLASFRDRKGNKSQGDAPVSVFGEPTTKMRNCGSRAEDSELTPKPSVRAPSQDRMSIDSGQTDANGTLPDGKVKVESSGHRLSRFPGWRWGERSDKSTDPAESAVEHPSSVVSSSGRSSRQKGRRRLSFHLRKSMTAASAEEQAGQQVLDPSQTPTECSAGAEETPKPSVKTSHYSGGPLSHFATLSRATGRIARTDRSQEPPSRPPTAHEQSHAKSRARSLASKIPRARRSDRRQTQRSSRESIRRSTIPSKSPSKHILASVPPEVQYEEDRIISGQEKQVPGSGPSAVLKHDRMADYALSATSFDGDLRPPTTPSRPTSYYSKSFTGSAVRAMAAMFESAAAKDKDLKRPEFLPMPTRMTGSVLSHYTVNPPSPRKSLSSPFETPEKGTGGIHTEGRREHAESKGSSNKSSGRGSHDGVDDEDERTTSLAVTWERRSKNSNERANEQQSHKPTRDPYKRAVEDRSFEQEGDVRLIRPTTSAGGNNTKSLFGNEAQYVPLPQSPHILRPFSAPIGAPDANKGSRVPIESGTSNWLLESALHQNPRHRFQSTPPVTNAVASDLMILQAQIRRLQTQLDIKTEENDHLRRKLASFGAGQCSLPKEVSVRRSTSIKLSEHLRQTERECKAWRERAEAAEMRVAILERLLRSKVDGKSFNEEERGGEKMTTDSKANPPSTSQHTFTTEVYRSNGTVRDRLRKLCGALDGCSEIESYEELVEEEEEGTVRCASVPVWSDGEYEGPGSSSDETPERSKDERCVLQEKEVDVQQITTGEDDNDDGVLEQDIELPDWDANGRHSYGTDEGEEEHLSAKIGSYEQDDCHALGKDGNALDANRATLEIGLAGSSDINDLAWKICEDAEEGVAVDKAEGETMAVMNKWMTENDENGKRKRRKRRESVTSIDLWM